jgi:pimeloyl-ACP methyl ester carboxylesterase
MMNKQCKFIQAGNINFRIFDEGVGEPVLLLHGFPDNLLMWTEVANYLLAQGYRVIAFDQRGYGESGMPEGKEHYKISTLVDDVKNVLEVMGIEKPLHILSHDWGAIIGWGFALSFPVKVKSMVALSVGHPASYAKAGLDQKIGKGLYVLWFQFKYLAERYLLNGGFKRWGAAHPDIESVLEDMTRKGRLTAALNWYRANLIEGMFAKWPECKVPTLGVWGSQDKHLTEAQMKNSELYMKAPWEYRRLENTGHWLPLEKPKEIAELANDWFLKY